MIRLLSFKQNPDEWHCIHCAIHSITKHFLKKDYSLDYINALLNPKHNMWVWPTQAVKVLDELGLFVRLYYKGNLQFNDMKYIKISCRDELRNSIEYIKLKGLHEKEELSIDDLKRFIYEGIIPIVLFGSLKKLGKYIVLTGYDEKGFYYHESGPANPKPHKWISNEKFKELWSRDPVKNCVIAVFGAKWQDKYKKFHL